MNKTELFEAWYGGGLYYEDRKLIFDKNEQGEYKRMSTYLACRDFSAGFDAALQSLGIEEATKNG